MNQEIVIQGRRIGAGHPVYVIAELSANHRQNYDQAVAIVEAAKKAGADAIKLQTYTADTITIDCRTGPFVVGEGTIWKGRTLHDLYAEAHTPWHWQPKLKAVAEELGLHCFSSPFDVTAVDFLEKMDVPAYKIASFELLDTPLIEKVARTGKPVIMSTGMGTLAEIDTAVRTYRKAGGKELALLKCTSAYPAQPEEMNLRTIPHLSDAFAVPVGLSDHSLCVEVPVAAVTLGACIIEKHLTLSRADPGPDSPFSLEPSEFKAMVDAVRCTERALGAVRYEVSPRESKSRIFRKSLFVVRDMNAGETFTSENVRSIRPGNGLSPVYLAQVLGSRATRDLKRGTPLELDSIGFQS